MSPLALLLAVVVTAGIFTVSRPPDAAAVSVSATIDTSVLNGVAAQLVFKPLVDRVRTRRVAGMSEHVHLAGRMFPSAHVTAAAAAAMFAWLILDRRARLTPVLVAFPLIVGCAVIKQQLHYPADVAGGLLLGPTFVYCTVAAANAVAATARTNLVAVSEGAAASQRRSE